MAEMLINQKIKTDNSSNLVLHTSDDLPCNGITSPLTSLNIVCVYNDTIGNGTRDILCLTWFREGFVSTCRLVKEYDCKLQYCEQQYCEL